MQRQILTDCFVIMWHWNYNILYQRVFENQFLHDVLRTCKLTVNYKRHEKIVCFFIKIPHLYKYGTSCVMTELPILNAFGYVT